MTTEVVHDHLLLLSLLSNAYSEVLESGPHQPLFALPFAAFRPQTCKRLLHYPRLCCLSQTCLLPAQDYTLEKLGEGYSFLEMFQFRKDESILLQHDEGLQEQTFTAELHRFLRPLPFNLTN